MSTRQALVFGAIVFGGIFVICLVVDAYFPAMLSMFGSALFASFATRP